MKRAWGILCVLFLLLYACGGTDEPSSSVKPTETPPPETGADLLLTVDGTPITRSEFLFYLEMEMTGYEVMQGVPLDWDSFVDGLPLAQYLKERTLSSLVMGQVAEDKADEYGLAVTEEEQAMIDLYKQSEIEALGGREVFERQLQGYGLSEDTYTRYKYLSPLLLDKLYVSLFSREGSLCPSDDDVREYFHTSYARAVYLMLVAVNEDGYPLAEKEREGPRSIMRDFEAQLNQGADLMALIAEYGEDAGMLENPGDMYFAPGWMEPAFDDALFALPIGGTSGVVEANFSFYIIRRLPLEESYLNENLESVRYACAEARYTHMLAEWTAGADIVRTPAYETLDPKRYYISLS